jgi:oligopeptide/dipeptide ABC transporter ATP-binding protein
VRDLDISFHTSRSLLKVVTGLTFEIGKSQSFGLVGESGCGKSLTALSIMGILPHNAFAKGEILFREKNILGLGEKAMRGLRGREITMIFQEPMTSLNPVLTIGYQVSEVFITHLRLSKKEAMNRAVDLLKAVRIPSPEIRAKEYPHQMSGGMRQRVMIAMAVACNPALLIADEPTTALDVTIQAQILELLRILRQEGQMSLLLITHDIGVIAENTEHAAVMYAGRIVESAPVRDLLEDPKHPYTIGLLDSLPKRKGIPLKPIPGSVPRPDALPQGCKFSDRCTYRIRECERDEPLLHEYSPGHHTRCIRAEDITWESSM